MQSRIESIVETLMDVGSGFIIAWWLTIFLSSHLDISDPTQAFYFTGAFTVVSLIRKYTVRRIHNHLAKRKFKNADI